MTSRNNSFASADGSSSVLSAKSSKITSPDNSTNISNSTTISPLVKLERLIYRLNSFLSVNLKEADEFERRSHLKLLLQYQNEIEKLKNSINDISNNNNNNNNSEYEFENRIQWVETRINLLNRIINEIQTSTEEIENLESIEETSDLLNELLKQTPLEEDKIQEKSQISSPRINLDEILPAKPGTLLTVPKAISSSKPESPKESIIFSEEIQSEHSHLTNELIATVQLIKRNNLHIQKMVKDDDKVISEASGLLASNADTMQKQGQNLKKYSKKAWMSFWNMLLILFFVFFAFLFVYIFIRLT